MTWSANPSFVGSSRELKDYLAARPTISAVRPSSLLAYTVGIQKQDKIGGKVNGKANCFSVTGLRKCCKAVLTLTF